jgi:hypothetical protein
MPSGVWAEGAIDRLGESKFRIHTLREGSAVRDSNVGQLTLRHSERRQKRIRLPSARKPVSKCA